MTSQTQGNCQAARRSTWRRTFTACLLGGTALSTIGVQLFQRGNLARAEGPFSPLPAQTEPAAQPFVKAPAAQNPANGSPWAPGAAAQPQARPLAPPTGLQRAAYEAPAQVERPNGARSLAQDDAARGLFEGPGALFEAPPRGNPREQAGPLGAPLPHQNEPAANRNAGNPFSDNNVPAQPRGPADALLQPKLLEQPQAQPLLLPSNDIRQVNGGDPAPVPKSQAMPDIDIFPGDTNYSPKPLQDQPRQSPPLMQPNLPQLDPAPQNRRQERPAANLPQTNFDIADPLQEMPANRPAALKNTALVQPKPEDIHEVKANENYWTISKQHYGSARFFSALAKYNEARIPDPNKMRPGMYVLIPEVDVLHQRYPKLTGGGPEVEAAQIAASRPGFFLDSNQRPAYRVAKGDTLSGIAQKHLGRSTGAREILQLNRDRITDPNNLALGQVLVLPADASQVAVAPELLAR